MEALGFCCHKQQLSKTVDPAKIRNICFLMCTRHTRSKDLLVEAPCINHCVGCSHLSLRRNHGMVTRVTVQPGLRSTLSSSGK